MSREGSGLRGAEAPAPPQAPWHAFVHGLSAFIRSRVPAQDADDVIQETLLRMHRNAASLRDATRVESWVYGIARRTIADHYRARSRQASRSVDPEEAGDGGVAAPPLGARMAPEDVHELVLSWLRPMADELPPEYRDALVMADFEGAPQKEVARALGLSLSGAKSRIQRARALLGRRLRSCCDILLDAEGRAVDFRRRDCHEC